MPMVDISGKEVVLRRAVARGEIRLKRETVEAIKKKTIKKGDPLQAAELAAVLAAKRTPEFIPLCHPIPIEKVAIDFVIGEDKIEARVEVVARAKTGVEMEAITALVIALTTIWDMVKYLEKDESGNYPTTAITGIKVVEKVKEKDG
jgi:cyclic pyranopterin phosphate synthase